MVSIGEEHNCIGAGQISHGPSPQQTWLQHILPTTLSISKSTTPITTLPAVSIALHAILSHTTSRSPLLEPPMLRQCPLLRLQDCSLVMTCPAELLSLKRREGALKLPVLLLESGPYSPPPRCRKAPLCSQGSSDPSSKAITIPLSAFQLWAR